MVEWGDGCTPPGEGQAEEPTLRGTGLCCLFGEKNKQPSVGWARRFRLSPFDTLEVSGHPVHWVCRSLGKISHAHNCGHPELRWPQEDIGGDRVCV